MDCFAVYVLREKGIITVLDEFVEEIPAKKGHLPEVCCLSMPTLDCGKKKRQHGKRRWQRNMQMSDTNIVPQYLLNDNEEMADEAERE